MLRISKKKLLLFFVVIMFSTLFAPVSMVYAADLSTFLAPVYKTNTGGIYSESNWDLDLKSYDYTMPSNTPSISGDVFQPTLSTTPGSNIPVISTCTKRAVADRSFTIQGSNFTTYTGNDINKDTKVWVYRQTGSLDGILYSANILRSDANTITATINASEPYGMYLIWVENYNGVSYPIRINNTDAWWVGPNHAVTGGTIAVYGQNLTKNNSTNIADSYVYLKPWGSDSSTSVTEATVTSANPNKVEFTVPSVTAGEYEVWIHNRHGGNMDGVGLLS